MLTSLYQSMSRKLGDRLFQEVCKAEIVRPGLSLSGVLALASAGLVHLVVAGLVLAGVAAFATLGLRFSGFLYAGICFGLAWFLGPHLPALNGVIRSRAEMPALYGIVDRVAGALHAKPVHGIVVDGRYGASYSHVGWRRRRVLYVGLPLLASLGDQERVAVLSHELAHQVNGDPARGLFIAWAVDTLERRARLLEPDALLTDEGSYGILGLIVSVAAWVTKWVMYLLSWIPRGMAWIMVHLYWTESQRAEYLADYLATTVSGTRAMTGALTKIQWGLDTANQLLHRAAVGGQKMDLFGELRRVLVQGAGENVPCSDDDKVRIDSTHPITRHRIAFLEAHPVTGAKLIVPSSEWDEVDREVAPFQKEIQERLEDRYRGQLYY